MSCRLAETGTLMLVTGLPHISTCRISLLLLPMPQTGGLSRSTTLDLKIETNKQPKTCLEYRTEAIKATKACCVLWQCMLRVAASLSQTSGQHTAPGISS
jgi:hypothetical protein